MTIRYYFNGFKCANIIIIKNIIFDYLVYSSTWASIPVSLTLYNINRCIREGRFLESRLSTHPLYITEVKRKISKTTKIIDLGCCFGTDIRYLVADGAEPSLITGTDQFPEYIQLGLDLFGDKDRLTARFIFEDFFSEQFAQKALNNNTDDSSKYDIAYAGSVYHLFSLEQTEKFTQLVSSLLKSGKSLLIITA
jgi:SAM-dependent methyltransferase